MCASCNPTGEPPHGVFDTHEAAAKASGWWSTVPKRGPDTGSRGRSPAGRCYELAGTRSAQRAPVALPVKQRPTVLQQRRRARARGRAAAPRAERRSTAAPSRSGVENVYEYEPSGEGSCASEPGCVALISSGTSEHESAFLDASEGGDDAFFLTAAQLVAQDTDNSLDVYDARDLRHRRNANPACPPKPAPPPCMHGRRMPPAADATAASSPSPTPTSCPARATSPKQQSRCRRRNRNAQAQTPDPRAEARSGAKGVPQAQAKHKRASVRTQARKALQGQDQRGKKTGR